MPTGQSTIRQWAPATLQEQQAACVECDFVRPRAHTPHGVPFPSLAVSDGLGTVANVHMSRYSVPKPVLGVGINYMTGGGIQPFFKASSIQGQKHRQASETRITAPLLEVSLRSVQEVLV